MPSPVIETAGRLPKPRLDIDPGAYGLPLEGIALYDCSLSVGRKNSGSRLTPRWREMDSSPRSPVSGAVIFWAFCVPVVANLLVGGRLYLIEWSLTVFDSPTRKRSASCNCWLSFQSEYQYTDATEYFFSPTIAVY
jgi:hypothetical protein